MATDNSMSFISFVIKSIILACCSISCYAQNDLLTVRYNQQAYYQEDPDQVYFSSLLAMALEETVADFGAYKLIPVDIEMLQQRGISMLKSKQVIDVMWTMTSNKREDEMRAIYVPLLKGLMGFRVFLIRKDEQQRFDKVQTIDDLKLLKAGQGANWPDTDILKMNQLPTQAAIGSLLHEMLIKERFDYFPRAITEITKEANETKNLTIEKSLMLEYVAPIYFFVNKDNKLLAKRLKVGLARLIENGSFDQHFWQTRNIKQLMEKLEIDSRRVFHLDNPLLSEKTKVLQKNKKLWLYH